MNEKEFIPKKGIDILSRGSVSAEAPSNIALVKYWGKHGAQLPANPSLSFTLTNCKTTTQVDFEEKKTLAPAETEFDFEIYLDGKKTAAFKPKINQFFERISPYLSFLKNYKFTIKTKNSFPHSSGIASSASGMAALSLCLMKIEQEGNQEMSADFFKRKASFLARLGSGSACRSVYPGLVVWGKHPEIENSSDLFGVRYPHEVHPVFKNYQDVILLVDEGEKQVSSSVGHGLMHGHPFAKQRFSQANENLSALKTILKTGNLEDFHQLVEAEALSLHAMMMTGKPYFMLMKPNTLEIIHRIWDFRKETGVELCFTLDAGANVHVLFPEVETKKVMQFIKEQLSCFCQGGKFIIDFVAENQD